MEDKKGVNLIGEIDFHDVKVKVYNDPYSDKDNVICSWQMRNPDSCYQGAIYRNNETGKCTYPDDAIIPEQTDEDREILPKFIITGQEEISDKLTDSIKKYLDLNYIIHNKKIEHGMD